MVQRGCGDSVVANWCQINDSSEWVWLYRTNLVSGWKQREWLLYKCCLWQNATWVHGSLISGSEISQHRFNFQHGLWSRHHLLPPGFLGLAHNSQIGCWSMISRLMVGSWILERRQGLGRGKSAAEEVGEEGEERGGSWLTWWWLSLGGLRKGVR